ncbi:MAG: alanine--tRNA ligase [Bacteroidetes bacterium]|nr:MAG: alanine--tRNA ligase [Bacteroidota bacterium]REK05107.1 MAG: alanine--tRNA ligase [Bacteroidota bacterium]REK32513.1 MAG: alanine--tRNA ligase [Bacteroidota bacterium]REK49041.1 MAG: alanine--tRNA ligase [Bacteroidota bacterium]
MTSSEIRKAFLDFFRSKEHQIVPSAPMVIKNDPTLMFTNAGMNQFKDLFLGNSPVRYKRIANTQKCLRVSGKHNDLEEVGLDTYHHTMFEMLGNWSFGDYFKKEAIEWSWELLTAVYQIPKDRLYVTVFEGDPKEKLAFDNESYSFWKSHIDESRILKGNKKDNFWEMGDTGPCGPCSEIHVDLRSDSERKMKDGKDLVNANHPQVIEIWNNVFMEFNRKADGSLEPLPAKHVDTGMGFERLCMALQGKTSNYDTDVFQPLIQFIAVRSGIKYGEEEKTDVAMRVMSDHIRAIAFAIADGQLPSNNKAGYVIRRILRRAVRYAFTFLNLKDPFLNQLIPILSEQFKNVFPELNAQQDFVQRVVREEESAFLRTLETGIRKFEEAGNKNIVGEFAFELYDTFGFPIDLTQLMAREKNLEVDMEGFNRCLAQQKERSRAASAVDTDDWIQVSHGESTDFVGYDIDECEAEILRYRKVKSKSKEQFQLVLNRTPFYAESGGQVGDTGFLIAGAEKIKITDTQKENNLIIHLCDKLPSDPSATFTAQIDSKRRNLIRKNHSATHLMHSALKRVLGEHVNQKGSLVNEDLTRFDFSHFAKLSDDEINAIEKMVNEKIRINIPLDERRSVPVKEAMEMGATALFGEKYGEYVRVITFDPEYSRELCGGTHVKATGEIGMFKIISESAVAAGVRRIEAITADKAEDYFKDLEVRLRELNELLKSPKDLIQKVRSLLDENQKLQNDVEEMVNEKAARLKAELQKQATEVNGVRIIISKLDLPTADSIKNLSFDLKKQYDNLYFLAGAELDGKAHLSLIISEKLVQDKKLNAIQIIRELSKEIQGGGGGQDFYATAGGKNPSGLKAALEKGKQIVENL